MDHQKGQETVHPETAGSTEASAVPLGSTFAVLSGSLSGRTSLGNVSP